MRIGWYMSSTRAALASQFSRESRPRPEPADYVPRRLSFIASHMYSDGHALTKGASRAVGTVAMAADSPKVLKPRVRVDARASKGIAFRRVVGKVRHLHTEALWVQEAVARHELVIEKLLGSQNLADMGTKHLAAREMQKCLRRASCVLASGRSKLALRVATDRTATA